MEEKKEPRLVNADKVLTILANLRLRALQDNHGNKHYQQGMISGYQCASHIILSTLAGNEEVFGPFTELEKVGYERGLIDQQEKVDFLFGVLDLRDKEIELIEIENEQLKRALMAK